MLEQLARALFENYVYCELVKAAWNRGNRPGLYFFRDHAGNEIDFVRHLGGNFALVECKVAEDPKVALKPFEAFRACFPQASCQCYYVTPTRGGPRRVDSADVTITDAQSLASATGAGGNAGVSLAQTP